MSRSLAVLVVLLSASRPIEAQGTGAWGDSTRQAEKVYRALRDSLAQGDSTVREILREGGVVLGASEPLRRQALASFRNLDRLQKSVFGEASPSPFGFRIVLRTNAWRGEAQEVGTVILAGLPDTGAAPRTDRPVASNQLSEALIDAYGELMFSRLPVRLRTWLDLVPPLSMSAQERKHLAMYALVTGTGSAQRRCVAGSSADCAYALGLRSPAIQNPGGAYASLLRTDLFFTALSIGGGAAWNRLEAEGLADPERALAVVSGMPADSIIVRWRANLLSRRPKAGLLDRNAVLAAGFWIGLSLLGALGAGGSRWQ